MITAPLESRSDGAVFVCYGISMNNLSQQAAEEKFPVCRIRVLPPLSLPLPLQNYHIHLPQANAG
jgi:hypothetical protein